MGRDRPDLLVPGKMRNAATHNTVGAYQSLEDPALSTHMQGLTAPHVAASEYNHPVGPESESLLLEG